MSNHQYLKELCINRLYILPIEVINIIKSFAFYDIKIASQIKNVKEMKKQLNNVVREALTDASLTDLLSDTPSENLRQLFSMYNLNDLMHMRMYGSWGFGFIQHPVERVQFQGYNCSKCGNYRTHIYSDNICCFCEEE